MSTLPAVLNGSTRGAIAWWARGASLHSCAWPVRSTPASTLRSKQRVPVPWRRWRPTDAPAHFPEPGGPLPFLLMREPLTAGHPPRGRVAVHFLRSW